MGKKTAQVGKAAKPQSEPQAEIKPARKPKGHRQRGAGTIITAPPPIITNDGITLAPHMRLPFTLLQEYCQRENRPKPTYEPRTRGFPDGEFRYCVKLTDGKNSRNDLSFTPNQSCESEKMAKDYAALLALHHFQRDIPLERKLPEPYCTTWKDLVASSAADAKASATAGKGKSSTTKFCEANAKPKTECNSPSISSSEAARDGSIILKSGTKKIITDSTSAAADSVPAFPAPPKALVGLQSDRKYVSIAEREQLSLKRKVTSTADTSYAEALMDANRPMTLLMSPAVRDELSSVLQPYISQRYGRDPGPQENASSSVKNIIQMVQSTIIELNMKTVSAVEILYNRQFLGSMFVQPPKIRSEEDEDMFLAKIAENMLSVLKSVVEALVGMGFTDMQAGHAAHHSLRCVLRETLRDGWGGPLLTSLHEVALEYLCLTIDENLLPEVVGTGKFDRRKKVDVLAPSKAKQAGVVDSLRGAKALENSPAERECEVEENDLDEELDDFMRPYEPALSVLVGCGWSRKLAIMAVRAVLIYLTSFASLSDISPSVQGVQILALVLLSSATARSTRNQDAIQLHQTMSRALFGHDADASAVAASNVASLSRDVWTEEKESLEAIFDQQFHLSLLETSDSHPALTSLQAAEVVVLDVQSRCTPLPRDFALLEVKGKAAEDDILLNVVISPSLNYPSEAPLVYIQSKALHLVHPCHQKGCVVLLALQTMMWQAAASHSADSAGEVGMVFQLSAYMEELMMQGLESEELAAAVPRISFAAIENILLELVKDVISEDAYETLMQNSVATSIINTSSGKVKDNMEIASPPLNVGVGSSNLSVAQNIVGTEPDCVDDGSAASTTESSSSRNRRTEPRNRSSYHPFWSRAPPVASATTPNSTWCPTASPLLAVRQRLPAWALREQFLQLCAENEVMIVTGETGCGKTTQVPQFIIEQDANAKVCVCQPRRLAAVGVASRVASEQNCEIGERVGYSVRGNSKLSKDTQLLFCTYGILLRRLQSDALLRGVDYVILDEVHERGIESDFALSILLNVVKTRATDRNPLRLILMSATIQTEKFAVYLGRVKSGSALHGNEAPVLHIPGYTYPVVEYYLNDYKQVVHSSSLRQESRQFGYDDVVIYDDDKDDGSDEDEEENVKTLSDNSRQMQKGGSTYNSGSSSGSSKRKKRNKGGEIDYNTMVKLILRLCAGGSTGATGMLSPAQGAILVFLPGIAEIGRLISLLKYASGEGGEGGGGRYSPMLILPLHGSLSNADQKRVFDRPPRGTIKVVVATNVAEASITIDDVTVIIDSCQVKEMTMNHNNKMSSLVCVSASKDSMRQRRGRAGRVSEGRCFRLLSREDYHRDTPQSSIPEMLRVPVERLILQLQAMDKALTNPSTVASKNSVYSALAGYPLLKNCLDPPSDDAVASAENFLIAIGALDAHRQITPLGKHLSSLPCDPSVGKMLIYGAMLQCVSPVAAIASLIVSRDPFLSSQDNELRLRVDSAKKRFASSITPKCRSDHLIVVQAVREFRALSTGTGAKRSLERARRDFCHENGLSFDRMVEIATLQEELLVALADIGFVQSAAQDCLAAEANCPENVNANNGRVVIAALSAGLFPSVCEIIRPPKKFAETMGGAQEKDLVAEELRFFIPDATLSSTSSPSPSQMPEDTSITVSTVDDDIDSDLDLSTAAGWATLFNASYGRSFVKRRGFHSSEAEKNLTGHKIQVRVHPTSALCGETGYVSNYLLYGEVSMAPPRMNGSTPSKTFLRCMLRGVSEVSGYALLFFGGDIEAKYAEGFAVIDKWIRFAVPGRVVALVKVLRSCVASLLERKIADPSLCLYADPVISALLLLLSTDGAA